MPSFSKSLRYFAVAALCACTTLPIHAQDGTPPISPALSPALTDNLAAPPVNTLDPDLLVPARSFTYDATGASLRSNALNPEFGAFDLNDSASQTDTAVRDASQAGQWNPYSAGAMRLAAKEAFSGEGKASGNPGERVSNSDIAGASDENWHSTWGGTITGSNPGEGRSSWSMKAAATQGRVGTADSPQVGTDFGGSGVFASESAPSRRASDLSRTNSDSSQRTLSPETSANMRLGTASRSDSLDRRTIRSYATPPVQAPATPGSPFLFSPASYNGYSFGATPFSAPGFGADSFLKPNILDVSGLPLSRGSHVSDLQRQLGRQYALGMTDPLAAIESRYRSGSLYDQAKPKSSGNPRKSKMSNPFMQGASGEAGNSYGLLSQP